MAIVGNQNLNPIHDKIFLNIKKIIPKYNLYLCHLCEKKFCYFVAFHYTMCVYLYYKWEYKSYSKR